MAIHKKNEQDNSLGFLPRIVPLGPLGGLGITVFFFINTVKTHCSHQGNMMWVGEDGSFCQFDSHLKPPNWYCDIYRNLYLHFALPLSLSGLGHPPFGKHASPICLGKALQFWIVRFLFPSPENETTVPWATEMEKFKSLKVDATKFCLCMSHTFSSSERQAWPPPASPLGFLIVHCKQDRAVYAVHALQHYWVNMTHDNQIPVRDSLRHCNICRLRHHLHLHLARLHLTHLACNDLTKCQTKHEKKTPGCQLFNVSRTCARVAFGFDCGSRQ